MKHIHIKLIIATVVLFGCLSSCSDYLDTSPDGGLILDNQTDELFDNDSTKVSSILNGMYNLSKAYGQNLSTAYQADFGLPAIACILEHAGADVVSPIEGYNWFYGDADYSQRSSSSNTPILIWRQYYAQINAANMLIASLDNQTESDEMQNYLGQAYAMRAYCYFSLIQLFQFPYSATTVNSPGVPLVLDTTNLQTIQNNPRATVQEVYSQITEDINKAIALLNNKNRNNKAEIDQSVAYGIRARINLVMKNWSDAADDADSALIIGNHTPMSMNDVSVPTFDDVTQSGIMWGCILETDDDAVKGILGNFTSMFTSLCFGASSYTVGTHVWKDVSILLYNQIPESDVRKGWWLDENYHSPLVDSTSYEISLRAHEDLNQDLSIKYDSIWYKQAGMNKYTNVKFAPNNKDLLDPNNAGDFPLMRAEEMVLIYAEAKAMSGDLATGKSTLNNFVKNYRNPLFESQAVNAKALQDEIYLQRRIEFWGEGIVWYDMMRLNKDLIRRQNGVTNFSQGAIFNISAKTPCLLQPIPQNEIEANNGISDADNNDMGTLPVSD